VDLLRSALRNQLQDLLQKLKAAGACYSALHATLHCAPLGKDHHAVLQREGGEEVCVYVLECVLCEAS